MVSVVQRRQDTARQDTVPRTCLIMGQLKWKKFLISVTQSRYCKCDYHMFLNLKKFLAYQSLNNDRENKDIFQDCLEHLVASFYDEGIHNLVNVVTAESLYMVTMQRSNLMHVPTFSNNDVFKNCLNNFYNQSLLTVWKRYISSSSSSLRG